MLNASGVELIIPHGHDARGLLPKEQYLLYRYASITTVTDPTSCSPGRLWRIGAHEVLSIFSCPNGTVI